MKIRSGESDLLPPEGTRKTQRKIPGRAVEVRRILSRLHAIIVEHLDGAKRIDATLGLDDLLAVIAALEADADGLSVEPHLVGPDEIRNYLRAGLYEELRSEPSTVLLTTRVSDDVTRYEAMPKDFWMECLTQLRSDLLARAPR